jgi:DNA-binding protein H-NS
MKKLNLETMSSDTLWTLHEEVSQTLLARLSEEKRVLTERLNQLTHPARGHLKPPSKPRFYPPVLPKFHNPDNPAEKWSGRGRTPRWVTQQLGLGKRLEELKI